MNPLRILISVAVLAVVVAVPLWLKHTPAASAQAAPEAVAPDGVLAKPESTPGAAAAAPAPKPLPRFVDLGTTTCAPCKVMLGVMQELEATYPDSLKVQFINTHDDPDAAERMNIRSIPTQIFFAPDDKELFRHSGVMRTGDVVAKWAELGFVLQPVKKVGDKQ